MRTVESELAVVISKEAPVVEAVIFIANAITETEWLK